MSTNYLSIVQNIVLKTVDKDSFAVFLFGSRANETSRHGADIDIGIWGSQPISSRMINKIIEELAESSVPYDIDVVDFHLTDSQFRQIALKTYQIWNLPIHLQQNFIQ